MFSLPLIVLGGTALLFAGAFLLCRRLDNYGVVDVVWSYSFLLLAFGYLAGFANFTPRGWVISVMAALWSLRLGTHLLIRVAKAHPEEDRRYHALRRDWSANFGPKMFWFFQGQGLAAWLLALPFALALANPAATLSPVEWLAVAVWIAAVAGEALADAQLAAFKRDPANRGKICRRGLWRYSRHPNYFFEWLAWVAFALFALPSPFGWIGLVSPLVMYLLLTRVSGIPPMEKQSLASKGEAFRNYQQTTSAFFPWFPRSSS